MNWFKRILPMAVFAVALSSACSKFDDSKIWNELNSLGNRVTSLETLCSQMNTNILSLQTIVTALQGNETITSVYNLPNSEGYVITFSSGRTITIYNGKDGLDGKDGIDGTNGKDGKDGVDGKDGSTPVVGVKKDTDGIYYWTLNGEWLLDSAGNKIKAVGTDGADGKDGVDGTNGKDGITPQLKIEDGNWYVSTDNGLTWAMLGKATGDNGKDGADGDSIFSSVVENEYSVVFTLADGSTITIAKSKGDSTGIMFYSYAFKQYCVENFDTDGDGGISEDEAKAVTEINISKIGVASLVGIEYFTNLEKLDVSYNPICYLDLSKNTALVSLDVSNTSLTQLDYTEGLPITNTFSVGHQIEVNGVKGMVYNRTDSKIMLVSMSETSTTWGPTSTTTGATDSDNGMNNMNTIVNLGISIYPAFQWCWNLGEAWYLPSKTELLEIYINKSALTSAGTEFHSSYYWSSTEYSGSSSSAYNVNFNNGGTGYYFKSDTNYVRAVRAL